IEEIVAGIWVQVLGDERVGIHDDFFALGGHSLLVTQLASRLREALGCEIPLRWIFEASTIATLTEKIQTVRQAGHGLAAPPIRRVRRTGAGGVGTPPPGPVDLPLSFAQQRLWFIDQLEPGSATYNIPGALRFTGALDVGALAQSLAEIVRRHETLRTTFLVEDGTP